MSFITDTVKCGNCGYEMNVAFGMQGMTLIAQHPARCTQCQSFDIKIIKSGWHANNSTLSKQDT